MAARRDNKFVLYRLADDTVLAAVAALHRVAERNVAEVNNIVRSYFLERDALEPVTRADLKQRIRKGLVTVLDVRPAAMAAWEMLAPQPEHGTRNPLVQQYRHRGAGHPIGLVGVPITALGLALLAEARGWGFLNAFSAPGWIAIPFAVILLDLAICLQHVLFHAVPALWRLHRMHHAD